MIKKAYITFICSLAVWFAVSYADVLCHQFGGNPATWNLFTVIF